MCSVCMSIPCDPRCPNAPEPETLYKCEECGEDICTGDKFIEYEYGKMICEPCLEEMCAQKLLKLLGEKLSIAGKER